MTPDERAQFNEMKRQLAAIRRAEDVPFVKALMERIKNELTINDLPAIKLSDLTDVSGTDSASTGQVLKKTATTWQPGTDNTGV